MSKIKTCDYCSNCRIYEMTEEDELDSNFCYDDEHDLSARSIFMSEDKQFDIMVVSGAGEPQRLEFRHWNKDAQRWFVCNTIYLKRCINCGREITEYPEFICEKDKKITELEKQLKETKTEYKKLLDDKFETTKEKFEWKGYDTKLYVKVNREEIEQYLKNSHSGINAIIDGNTNGIHFYLMSDKDLSGHDKELVAKVLEEVENAFTEYLPLKNRTGAWFYGRLNEILEKYQKEFEDE